MIDKRESISKIMCKRFISFVCEIQMNPSWNKMSIKNTRYIPIKHSWKCWMEVRRKSPNTQSINMILTCVTFGIPPSWLTSSVTFPVNSVALTRVSTVWVTRPVTILPIKSFSTFCGISETYWDKNSVLVKKGLIVNWISPLIFSPFGFLFSYYNLQLLQTLIKLGSYYKTCKQQTCCFIYIRGLLIVFVREQPTPFGIKCLHTSLRFSNFGLTSCSILWFWTSLR